LQTAALLKEINKKKIFELLLPGQVLHLVLSGVELSLVGEGGEVGLVRELVVVKVDPS
jgi:hypothetical protein